MCPNTLKFIILHVNYHDIISHNHMIKTFYPIENNAITYKQITTQLENMIILNQMNKKKLHGQYFKPIKLFFSMACS